MTRFLHARIRWVVIISLGLLTSLVGLQWARGAFQSVAMDPLAGQECALCHLAGSKVKAHNAHLLTAPPEELCTQCHPAATQASHPSGISPTMAVPTEYPLDWKGNMTCSSCHYIHVNAHGMLRTAERGAPFCTDCHNDDFFTRMADQGGSIVVSGHMISGNDLEAPQTDEYSVQCMACHDKHGQGPGVEITDGGIARHATGALEHPIGVSYGHAVQFGGYRAVNELPKSIALPGGQISCISCHEGYSSNHGSMVMSNQGSDLCFQCHDL